MADYEDATPAAALGPDEKLKRFIGWFKLCNEAEADQRKNEQEDLAFQIGDNQWTPEAKKARAGRPMLTVSLLHQPLQLVRGQAANAHPGVELHPVNESATSELAEVKQGLYQRIQRDGKAAPARLWALDRAAQAGRGWYRIDYDYDEDSDHPGDLEIIYRRVLHGEMVYPDPAAQEPDFSDGRWLIFAAFMPLDTFRETYPKADYHEKADFESITGTLPDWVRPGGCDPLVAEVFYKVPRAVEFEDGRGEKRTRVDHVVWRAVVTGKEILEDEPWLYGRRYIPFVPCIGRELQPIDGRRLWEGMVRPARDAQRFHNYAVSSFAERMAMEPKAPYMVDPKSIENYKDWWDSANEKNHPYLPYDSANGQMPPPQRAQLDATGMSMSAIGIQQGREWVQSATAVYEPSLGQQPRQRDAQSGRAIQALQQQADAGTSYVLDNFKTYSLPLDARIVLDMIPVIYDRPGRVTQVLGMDDEPKSVMLGAPFVVKDGRPVAAGPGTQGAKTYDLSAGKYSIAATVGKNQQTRLQQGQEFTTAVIQAVPALLPLIGDLVFKFRDEPGAREIADRLRREIQAKMPHLLEQKDGGQDAAAKAMALQGQVQQLGGQLQEAMQYIQTEQAKHDAAIRIAEIKAQTDLSIAQIKAASDQQKAQFTASRDAMAQADEARQEVTAAAIKGTHDTRENALDRRHETEMQMRDLAHDAGMAAAGGQSVTMKREGGQSKDREDSSERTREQGSPQGGE